MKRAIKWPLIASAGAVTLAVITVSWLDHRLPESAVRVCETAFGDDLDGPPASLTTEKQQDAWQAGQDRAQQQALAETAQLVDRSAMVDAMKSDLMVNKRDALRYASLAFVLGYYDIDTRKNVQRLMDMVGPDPSESFLERLSTLFDPISTDDTADEITARVFDICERHPAQNVLRAALSMRSDAGGQEIIDDSIGDLFVQHPNEVMSAISGSPELEHNVAFSLYAEESGDDKRIAPLLSTEVRSTNPGVRLAASYCIGYIKHPVLP